MSNHAPTDEEIAQMWDEETAARREEIARRKRLDDLMRGAGLTRDTRPKLEGAQG
jgi:hypothetical protein